MAAALSQKLYEAVKDEDIRKVEILLLKGANPNFQLQDGTSLLHIAAGFESPNLVELFLHHGSNPNIISDEGLSPLHVAAAWGRYSALQKLLDYGGDPKLMDDECMDVLQYCANAEEGEKEKCMELLQNFMNCCEFDMSTEESVVFFPSYANPVAEEITEISKQKPNIGYESTLPQTKPYVLKTKIGFSPENIENQSVGTKLPKRNLYPCLDLFKCDSNKQIAKSLQELSVIQSQLTIEQNNWNDVSVRNDLDETTVYYSADECNTSPCRYFSDKLMSSEKVNNANEENNSMNDLDIAQNSGNLRDLSTIRGSMNKRGMDSSTIRNSDMAKDSRNFKSIIQSNQDRNSGTRNGSSTQQTENDIWEKKRLKNNSDSCCVVSKDSPRSGNGKVFTPTFKSNRVLKWGSNGNSYFRTLSTMTPMIIDDILTEDESDVSIQVPDRNDFKEEFLTEEDLLTEDELSCLELEDSVVSFPKLRKKCGLEISPVTDKVDQTLINSLCDTKLCHSYKEIIECDRINELPHLQEKVCQKLKNSLNEGAGESTHGFGKDRGEYLCYEIDNIDKKGLQKALTVDHSFGENELNNGNIIPQTVSSNQKPTIRTIGISTPNIEILDETFVSEKCSDVYGEDTVIYFDEGDTVFYDWKDFSILEDESPVNKTLKIPVEYLKLSCAEIRKKLVLLGETPGPIDGMQKIYLRHLVQLEAGVVPKNKKDPLSEYTPELREQLKGAATPQLYTDEEEMKQDFDHPSHKHKWREGTEKSSFNYLLLDPRVTKNLPARAFKLNEGEIFQTFISAVFYVGKGKRSRPYSHLHEALKNKKVNAKTQQINDIWASGLGVVSLHCFQSVIPVEAYTREACMVDALGLHRLTNQKKGDYYGITSSWTIKKKRLMGVFLLKRALRIFVNEGERQIKPADMKRN